MSDNLSINLSIVSTVVKDLAPITTAFVELGKVANIQLSSLHKNLTATNRPIKNLNNSIKDVSKSLGSIKPNENLTKLGASLAYAKTSATALSTPLRSLATSTKAIGGGSNLTKLQRSLVTTTEKARTLKSEVRLLVKAVKSLGRGHKLSAFNKSLQGASTSAGKAKTAMGLFTTSVESANTSATKLSTVSLGAVAKSVSITASKMKGLKMATASASKSFTALKSSSALAKKSFRGLHIGVDKARTSSKHLKGTIDAVNTSVDRLSSNETLNQFERGLGKGNTAAMGLKQTIDQAGFALFKTQQSLKIIASLSGIAFAITAASDYGRAIAEVSTLIDGGSESVKEYSAIVSDLSKQFGNNSTEGAKALYQAISLGASNATEATQILTASMKMARAGVTSVDDATTLISSTLNTFGFAMAEAGNVSDSFFTTVKTGGTTITELAASYAQVSPAAAAAGISMRELNATIADITVAGVKTPEAMTKIKGAIAAIQRPTVDMIRIFKEYGGATAFLKDKGLVAALKLVNDEAAGNVGTLKTLLQTDEAVAATQILLRDGAAGVTAAFKAQQEMLGNTDEALKKFNSNPIAKFDLSLNALSTSFKELGTILLETLVPAAVLGMNTITMLIEVFVEFPSLVHALTVLVLTLGAALSFKFVSGLVKAATSAKVLGTSLSLIPFKSITERVKLLLISMSPLAGGFFKFAASVTSTRGKVLLLGASLGLITIAVMALSALFSSLGVGDAYDKYMETKARASDALTRKMEALTSSVETFSSKYKKLMQDNAQFAESFDTAQKKAFDTKDPMVFAKFLVKHHKVIDTFNKTQDKAQKLAAKTANITTKALITQVEQFGLGAISAAAFSKEIASIANQKIDSNFNNGSKAISAFFKEVSAGISESTTNLDAFSNKSIAQVTNNISVLTSKFDVALKRLHQLSLSSSSDFAKSSTELTDITSRAISDLGKSAERANTMYTASLTRYQSLIKKRDKITTDSNNLTASIKDTFSTDGEKALQLKKDEAKAVRAVYRVSGKLASLRRKINAEDNPAKKQVLVAQQEALLISTNKTWATLKSKDSTFMDSVPSAAKAMGKILLKAEKFNKAVKLSTITTEIDTAKNSIKNLADQVKMLRALASKGADIKVIVSGATASTFKTINTRVLDFVSTAQKAVSNIPIGFTIVTNSLKEDAKALVTIVAAENHLKLPISFDTTKKSQERLSKELEAMSSLAQSRAKPLSIKLDTSDAILGASKLMETLSTITNNQFKITPVLDSADFLQAAKDLAHTTISTPVGASSSNRGGRAPTYKAEGGIVAGAGTATSDSIPAMLSNGEFVVKAMAVKQYGTDFFNKLNNLAFQPTRRLASGGLATSLMPQSVQRFSSGGFVAPQTAGLNSVVDVNLNIGEGTYTMQGHKDQVSGLVEALQSLQQGVV